jgi:ferrous iron transport protein A
MEINSAGGVPTVSDSAVRGPAMPLTLLKTGENATVARISGLQDTRRFLNDLGFVDGSSVKIINRAGDNVIIEVKGSKVAIGGEMARKIMVKPEA